MPTIAARVLIEFVAGMFRGVGVPQDEASVVATSLVGSNLRGHDSHGVMRAIQYIGFLAQGEYRTKVDLLVEQETPALVVCDGQWGFGQVQAHRVLDRIIPKARALGLSAGAARNCGHIGRLGEYAERVAEEGLILISTANNCGSGQRVAPPGGISPRIGTNPLCAGVPTEEAPYILDFGTSVVAEGKVRVHHISKRPVPEGWLLDSRGIPTTDPSVLYTNPQGSILPVGGAQAFKGFGLALLLDMLSGGLTGGQASYEGAPPAKGNNFVFFVLDPAKFAGQSALTGQATAVVDYVRATPRAPGVNVITLPGDPETRTLAERSRSGIPLDDAHWAKLTEIAQRLGTSIPDVTSAL